MPAGVSEAKAGIGTWLRFYNEERQHQSLGYRTPRQIYEQGLWICGRACPKRGARSDRRWHARRVDRIGRHPLSGGGSDNVFLG